MKSRSPRYIICLTAALAGMLLFDFYAYDAVADWIGLSKGAGFFWAFVSIFVTAVLGVGLIIDLAYAGLKELRA